MAVEDRINRDFCCARTAIVVGRGRFSAWAEAGLAEIAEHRYFFDLIELPQHLSYRISGKKSERALFALIRKKNRQFQRRLLDRITRPVLAGLLLFVLQHLRNRIDR